MSHGLLPSLKLFLTKKKKKKDLDELSGEVDSEGTGTIDLECFLEVVRIKQKEAEDEVEIKVHGHIRLSLNACFLPFPTPTPFSPFPALAHYLSPLLLPTYPVFIDPLLIIFSPTHHPCLVPYSHILFLCFFFFWPNPRSRCCLLRLS